VRSLDCFLKKIKFILFYYVYHNLLIILNYVLIQRIRSYLLETDQLFEKDLVAAIPGEEMIKMFPWQFN
jgi:hypothetical protein